MDVDVQQFLSLGLPILVPAVVLLLLLAAALVWYVRRTKKRQRARRQRRRERAAARRCRSSSTSPSPSAPPPHRPRLSINVSIRQSPSRADGGTDSAGIRSRADGGTDGVPLDPPTYEEALRSGPPALAAASGGAGGRAGGRGVSLQRQPSDPPPPYELGLEPAWNTPFSNLPSHRATPISIISPGSIYPPGSYQSTLGSAYGVGPENEVHQRSFSCPTPQSQAARTDALVVPSSEVHERSASASASASASYDPEALRHAAQHLYSASRRHCRGLVRARTRSGLALSLDDLASVGLTEERERRRRERQEREHREHRERDSREREQRESNSRELRELRQWEQRCSLNDSGQNHSQNYVNLASNTSRLHPSREQGQPGMHSTNTRQINTSGYTPSQNATPNQAANTPNTNYAVSPSEQSHNSQPRMIDRLLLETFPGVHYGSVTPSRIGGRYGSIANLGSNLSSNLGSNLGEPNDMPRVHYDSENSVERRFTRRFRRNERRGRYHSTVSLDTGRCLDQERDNTSSRDSSSNDVSPDVQEQRISYLERGITEGRQNSEYSQITHLQQQQQQQQHQMSENTIKRHQISLGKTPSFISRIVTTNSMRNHSDEQLLKPSNLLYTYRFTEDGGLEVGVVGGENTEITTDVTTTPMTTTPPTDQDIVVCENENGEIVYSLDSSVVSSVLNTSGVNSYGNFYQGDSEGNGIELRMDSENRTVLYSRDLDGGGLSGIYV